ncbi:zinc finger and BTB domain-containing protein 8A isoform X1 [Chelonia mydas]|uniref:zinc finger and BTB domain-containing protein 8A isoform X1 n=1 Tax=Chelonia mydas TaxID=8469 RepID=UPI0018A20808|nr:zinc finger and BTB domain-containing protein 8A isoform X1 [Chelonia mydas]
MEISSHQFHLLQQLNEQRKQDLFCDCCILVEGKVFKAHRNVLFASSGYFKMLLSQSSKETSQPTTATFEVFSPDIFTVILDFVYSGKLSLTGQNVIEVMSAASYLQMTDILSVCKTFIKSSLDINEKEKDHYFTLSAKRVNSRFDCPPFYRARRKVKSNPIRSHLIADQKAGMVNENSWTSNSNHSSSQMNVQQQETQLSKRGQKLGSVKKRQRHLGLSQPHDFLKYKSNKPEEASGSCSASETNCTSQSKEQIQFDAENDTAHTGYRCDQESKVIPKKWSVAQLEQELSRTSPVYMDLKADELYTSMPTILGVMGGWNEDDLPKMQFKCPFCTHTVKRRADMKRHLRCHTGERPYPCEACGKKFTRLEHLRSHFQTIHQAGKLICRKCKNHVTDLTGHVIQQGTRRYRLCNECLAEADIDSIRDDLNAEHPLTISLGDKISEWHLDEEPRSDVEMEDEPDKFVIQQVNDDNTDETDEKVKSNLR